MTDQPDITPPTPPVPPSPPIPPAPPVPPAEPMPNEEPKLEIIATPPMTCEEFIRLWQEIAADRMRGGAWSIVRCTAIRGFMLGDKFHEHKKGDTLSMSGVCSRMGRRLVTPCVRQWHFWATPAVMDIPAIETLIDDMLKGLANSIIGEVI